MSLDTVPIAWSVWDDGELVGHLERDVYGYTITDFSGEVERFAHFTERREAMAWIAALHPAHAETPE